MRIFGSPGRYIQGPGAVAEIGRVAKSIGDVACLVVDASVVDIVGGAMERSLAEAGVAAIVEPFAGEITEAVIAALAERLHAQHPALVVAAGGGKGLDVGKGVAERLRLPVVTVPTIASNDAPTSAIYVVYDESHAIASIGRMASNPHTVIVDTQLIANAPARFLRWGIGDAVTKSFEAAACWAGRGKTPFGTRPLRTGMVIAEAGYQVLRRHAAKALAAVERREVTDDLEATVEACILMSGLGFENGGLSIAHSLTRGLAKARGATSAPHGEQVAYGTLVQLAAERRPDAELHDLAGFFRDIGLPVRLADLGMQEASVAEIDDIAALTMTAPHIVNVPHDIGTQDLAAAIRRVEGLFA